MYVCLCNGVTEDDIREAAASGMVSLELLKEHLNVSGCCGSCADHAEACLAEATGGAGRAYPVAEFTAGL